MSANKHIKRINSFKFKIVKRPLTTVPNGKHGTITYLG